jgi:hypothetical protein
MDIVTGNAENESEATVNPRKLSEFISERIKFAVKHGIENKEHAHRMGKIQYDKHHVEYEFQVGDLVLLDAHYLSDKLRKFSAGLARKREGPYVILEREGKLNFRLGDPHTKETVTYAHVSQLTRYHKRGESERETGKTTLPAEPKSTKPLQVQPMPGKPRGRPRIVLVPKGTAEVERLINLAI